MRTSLGGLFYGAGKGESRRLANRRPSKGAQTMGRRFDFSQIAGPDTSGSLAPQTIPAEGLLDLARSLLIEYARLLRDKDARICQLEQQLGLAANCWRPADAVLQ